MTVTKRWIVTVIVAVVATTAISVQLRDGRTWTKTYDSASTVEMISAVLTPDGDDVFQLRRSGSRLRVSAPGTNVAGNLRIAFFPAAAPDVEEGLACATWNEQSKPTGIQQGIVLRLVVREDGTTRALTVTKNIYANLTWRFNLHSWDTSREQPFTVLSQVELGSSLITSAGQRHGPYHLCARTIGDRLQMKLWTDNLAEPQWGDDDFGGSVELDSKWVYPGKAGWFIGHLRPGGSTEFRDLMASTADH